MLWYFIRSRRITGRVQGTYGELVAAVEPGVTTLDVILVVMLLWVDVERSGFAEDEDKSVDVAFMAFDVEVSTVNPCDPEDTPPGPVPPLPLPLKLGLSVI